MWAIRSKSLISSERCERIAQVAHQKWAMWANCSGRSPKMSEWVNHSFFWANRSFAHFWAKNERFAQKTDERIPSPEEDYSTSMTTITSMTITSMTTITSRTISMENTNTRVEWKRTFSPHISVDQVYIFLWDQFRKIGNFGRARAAKFSFLKIIGTLKINSFGGNFQKPSSYIKEQSTQIKFEIQIC